MIVSVSGGIKSGDAFNNAFNIHEILKIPIKKPSEMKAATLRSGQMRVEGKLKSRNEPSNR